MTERFTEKAAVITGAAGGIGAATVARFVSEGARVIAVDLDSEALRDLETPVANNAGGRVLAHAADVTNEAEVKAAIERAVGEFGRLDCLFNNAGIEGALAPIEDYPTEMYERVMAVNVGGVFFGIKHAVPHLRDHGGAIINTASIAGISGSPLLPAYNASKHAVIGLTRSTALAHGGNGIRVNAVCPAPIETRMMRAIEEHASGGNPETVRTNYLGRIPAGRYGEPAEVAALVAFLASDDARFINGSVYTIDGGMTPT